MTSKNSKPYTSSRPMYRLVSSFLCVVRFMRPTWLGPKLGVRLGLELRLGLGLALTLRSSLRLGLEVGAGLEVRARARVSVMA